MNRRGVLALLGIGTVSAFLSGCTSFAPVYGDGSSTGLAAARFNFAEPSNRVEQIIVNRLRIAFPNPAGPGDPVLRISAGTAGISGALSDTLAVGRPVNVRIQGTVTVVSGDREVFSATRFTDTAYRSAELSPTSQFSANGAVETAAQSTAEALRAALVAGYRPGMIAPGSL